MAPIETLFEKLYLLIFLFAYIEFVYLFSLLSLKYEACSTMNAAHSQLP